MPIYPALAIVAGIAVIALEVFVVRTGVFRDVTYWITMAICYAFMIPVDGWLTKLSAPIVTYRPEDTSQIRPVWDILVEEYVYAFAMLTLVIIVWDVQGRRRSRRTTTPSRDRQGAT
jgi:lycopene cyclase domain-containing protein